jgi:superfamily II DNA or RNA helicase
LTFTTRGFELTDWQQEAVDHWVAGVDGVGYRGTIEVVTGGGKSLIALACAERAAAAEPNLKLAVVVPTQALARQWIDVLTTYTSLRAAEIGILGAGRRDTLEDRQALVAVLNSAAKELPRLAQDQQPLMLIVDECHRAGAPKFSRVLDTKAPFRLGLSATPDREEVDENGEPLSYDEQVVGQRLGRVVYSFGLKQARAAEWLPEFTLFHHAVSLLPEERERYDRISREVDDAADELQGLGGDQARAQQLSKRRDELGEAARRWVMLTGQRKGLLYRAAERHRIAAGLVTDLFERSVGAKRPRVILFHERVAEATLLADYLRDALAESVESELGPSVNQVDGGRRVVLEHSKLSARTRRQALENFASGRAAVLVSVKSLIEGIDVPAADTGISVASSASVRQRIQALGRVLRRARDGSEKRSEMHLLYVHETVDDLIYAKTDWTDLTGESANRYLLWKVGSDRPQEQDGPPRSPKPTEDAAWARLGPVITRPVEWPGEYVGQEYSVSTTGVVHNSFKNLIANPQNVADMVTRLRGRPGGRLKVTPQHHLVLLWERGRADDPGQPWLVGQLAEPFVVADQVTMEQVAKDTAELNLTPGAPYLGPTDKKQGSFKISLRGGGMLERAVAGGREYAATDSSAPRAANVRAVLTAWEQLGRPAPRFHVNEMGHAWYETEGERRFLADVPEGFDWPTNRGATS